MALRRTTGSMFDELRTEYEWDDEILDERAVQVFTGGQCHAMAVALNRRHGWPIYAIENEEDYDISHFCVELPDGRMLDVTGAHPLEQLVNAWTGGEPAYDPAGLLRPLESGDIEELVRCGDFGPMDLAAAEALMARVLEYADGRRASRSPGYFEHEPLHHDVETPDLSLRFTLQANYWITVVAAAAGGGEEEAEVEEPVWAQIHSWEMVEEADPQRQTKLLRWPEQARFEDLCQSWIENGLDVSAALEAIDRGATAR
jgi:hypothetical protein